MKPDLIITQTTPRLKLKKRFRLSRRCGRCNALNYFWRKNCKICGSYLDFNMFVHPIALYKEGKK